MNSSISSFRAEAKVLLAVLAVVAATEAVLRRSSTRLSRNERHLSELPALAATLSAAPPPRLLFLGNSLTRLGVDATTLTQELQRAGTPAPAVVKMTPDMTTVLDWMYAYRTLFVRAGLSADYVLLCSYAHHFTDADPADARRLGRYFCGLRDVPELFRQDLPTFGGRAEFLLSHELALFGMHGEVRHLLEPLIPQYTYGARKANEVASGRAGRAAARPAPAAPTYRRLERLLRLLREQHVKAVIVAMPPEPHFDPALPHVVEQGGGVLIDARDVPGLKPEHFYDGYHLGPEGAVIFTRYLAARLAQLGI